MEYTNLISDNKDDVIIDLLLTVEEYETKGIQGIQKKGFCSTFLAEAEMESEVRLFIKPSQFHLPETTEEETVHKKPSVLETLSEITATKGLEPVLLIGAGSGIAPFRGFYQQMMLNSINPKYHLEVVQKIERLNYKEDSDVDDLKDLIENYVHQCKDEEGCSKRSITLFYGCRDRQSNLLSKETKLYSTILTRFDAFSREENKEYNHEVMEKESELVYNALVKQDGFIYVCGKIMMADTVFKSFITIITQQLIRDNDDKEKLAFVDQISEDFMNSLRDNGRYNEDIFGN
jgi:sulfite reductase alpha subunit-like flavoprotein